MHVILLVGQSNMAGRAPLDAGDASPPDARIRVWRDVDGWQPALHPLHRDKPTAGVGPGLAFARAVLSELPAGAVVGLVPAAVGGTAIARWCPRTGDLFHAAVSSTRAALSAATAADGGSRGGGAANDAAGTEPRLAGILWHQGESDAVSAELADAYEPALAALVDTLPPSCGSADAPSRSTTRVPAPNVSGLGGR
ncbi:SGNH hydrolase-type esterase domain-containing protein [Pavlovales sp. CCMP2436]|nr:SGNH hydrolase-type esterase domain-containing protein [Pavlovales sp. CCMP2436]